MTSQTKIQKSFLVRPLYFSLLRWIHYRSHLSLTSSSIGAPNAFMYRCAVLVGIWAFGAQTNKKVNALQNSWIGQHQELLLTTHRVPLRVHDENSPYALAVSTTASFSLETSTTSVYPSPPPSSFNFLATQVWPSARVASAAIEAYVDPTKIQSLCELGCGPGLPSLTAARVGVQHVIATDIDTLALELVQQAAREQQLTSNLSTQQFDLLLTQQDDDQQSLPDADLYLLSDVFESNNVAIGAAHLTSRILLENSKRSSSHVWVFAQTDRAQRDAYLVELRALLHDDKTLRWTPFESGPSSSSKLWLCDVDETKVKYT